MKHKHLTSINCVPVEVTFTVDEYGNFDIQQVRRLNRQADDCVWDVISETDGNDLLMAVEHAYQREAEEMAA